MKQDEEKLYCLNGGTYIQYNGKGMMPPELASYINNNKGEYPPFMHLPNDGVNFRMEYGGIVQWPGSGPLPEAVLNFVKNNGHLPRYNEDETINQDGVPGDEWVYQDEINEDEWMEDES